MLSLSICGKYFSKTSIARITSHTRSPIVVLPINRFAIVLIRGGASYDPTRFADDEDYFEYGCDRADGLFCDKNYFNPDMLLHLPEKYERLKKEPEQ